MKIIFGAVFGVLITLISYFLYLQYYKNYVEPQQLLNWYVSCLARTSNEISQGKLKIKGTALDVCHLMDSQIKNIEDKI